MRDDLGKQITDTVLLDRIQLIGAALVHRGPVERFPYGTWRTHLRRAAYARGLRLAIHQLDDVSVLITNPDHVPAERRVAPVRQLRLVGGTTTSESAVAVGAVAQTAS